MSSLKEATRLKMWIQEPNNFAQLKQEFESTSRFARLQDVRQLSHPICCSSCSFGGKQANPFLWQVKVAIAGRNVYLRFRSSTGDAMGMNMLSKGCEKALGFLQEHFADMQIVRCQSSPPQQCFIGCHDLTPMFLLPGQQPLGKLLHRQKAFELELDRRARKICCVRSHH